MTSTSRSGGGQTHWSAGPVEGVALMPVTRRATSATSWRTGESNSTHPRSQLRALWQPKQCKLTTTNRFQMTTHRGGLRPPWSSDDMPAVLCPRRRIASFASSIEWMWYPVVVVEPGCTPSVPCPWMGAAASFGAPDYVDRFDFRTWALPFGYIQSCTLVGISVPLENAASFVKGCGGRCPVQTTFAMQAGTRGGYHWKRQR